jgi:ribonucrease Y
MFPEAFTAPIVRLSDLVVLGALVVLAAAALQTLLRTRRSRVQAQARAERMIEEANLQAAQLRADVERVAQEVAGTVRSEADLEAKDLLARAELEAQELRNRADEDAAKIRQDAEVTAERAIAHADAHRESVEHGLRALRSELGDRELALERRNRRLAEHEGAVDSDRQRLSTQAQQLALTNASLDARSVELADREAGIEADRTAVLERTAGLTTNQAKAELVGLIEVEAKRQAAKLVRDLEQQAQREGEKRARKIITTAIQRLASEQTTESVVSILPLRSDDLKGRIIGREGRNIRAFEQITGVNLIIDETPEAVLLSSFDPVRREIARITLEHLVLDGRIHPQRIEEVYERSRGELDELCTRAGEDALVETGLTDMHPELVQLLGSLRYRTSYGQNVLKHLVESAHLAALLAAEIGVEPTLVKRCAFLHDIGKALTHKAEGSHAKVGAEVARRHGESEEVVHAIEAHHNEVDPQTVEAILTQAADAISGGRPGARRESIEAYVKRLERLEQIARAHDGVEKVFAMQAGRDVRVIVQPDVVDDIRAQVLARDIAKQVEEELTYPGQIRITVVRESRAIETAQ